MAAPGLISRKAICMDYFSRKPDFPTFEDIYICLLYTSKEKKPVPGEAASAAKKAAGCSGGDDAGDAGAIKL